MEEWNTKPVEVRCFSFLKRLCDERHWDFPHYYDLETECSALELAVKLQLPRDMIECVFINGLAKAPEEGMVKPGDRVGFVPPGTPGPYRLLLAMVKVPDHVIKPDQ